ncbi:MAG: hypoxanthine phosphoribosyltransferase [Candidatus Lokiarchaeota archaeon]|nr:hypoxanthine phosphoribosyltransferase [Candidatus Lokiarchaeota archaeon]
MRNNKSLHLLFDSNEISQKIAELAKEINDLYEEKDLLLIGVLKGAFVFMADLIRKIKIPLEIGFVQLSSYQRSTTSSGNVRIVNDIRTPIQFKHILIVEDIIDTGLTMRFLMNHIKKKNPASINICTLTNKPSRREVEVPITFSGFKVPNKFIVGYGIDYKEKYRNLPAIYYVEE